MTKNVLLQQMLNICFVWYSKGNTLEIKIYSKKKNLRHQIKFERLRLRRIFYINCAINNFAWEGQNQLHVVLILEECTHQGIYEEVHERHQLIII